MPAEILSGKLIASALRVQIKSIVSRFPDQPTLAVILVGEDPASEVYVRNKIKQTNACGMRSVHEVLPATISQKDLEATIRRLNDDDDVDGILLQLPLPDGLDEASAIECIDPLKDVDGLTEASAGRLSLGKTGLRPCTPTGCVILAKQALGQDLSGKNVVVIGRSILVGKPAALLFLEENCTVTVAHSRTREIEKLCRDADILVAAVGRPEMVKSNWIKPGACVIDVGINRVSAKPGTDRMKLVGDVDFDDCDKAAKFITPVPGGVGPMTIACLLRNTVLAACLRRGWELDEDL